jgi:AcrR family transcriptional regulator
MSLRPSPYHHGDLREALLRAGLELLEDAGVAGLSLRAVARKAGVSPAAPYHHFPGKPALLAALADGGFSALAAAMEAARRDAVERPLLAIGEAYLRFAGERPNLYQLMTLSLDEGPSAGDPAMPMRIGRVIATALEGYPEVSEGDRDAVAIALWGAVHGLAVLTSCPALSPLIVQGGGRDRLVGTAFDHLARIARRPPAAS